jgi:hypothetical protein
MADKGEQIKGYDEYIPENEEVLSKHNIGWYTILTTKERIVLVKKFPKSFVGIHYDEITSLEHLTRIRWSELFKGGLMIGVAILVFNYQKTNNLVTPIHDLLLKYLPELANVIPIETAILLAVYASLVLGVYHVLNFLPSVTGYFKISRKERAPITISTALTSTVKDLVREVESHKTEIARKKEKPIVVTTGSVEDTLSPEEHIKKKLYEGVKGLHDNPIIIASAKSKYHMLVVSALLDMLVNERGIGGVYISVSRPYGYIMDALKETGAETSKVFFVDCISQMAGKGGDKAENVVFVENPGSLEEVSMYLDRMLGKVPTEKKFLFLDSLSSLLIYNNEKSVKEFTHFIINKMRLDKISGIVLSTEKKEAEDLVRTLIPMCDAEIRF